MNRYLSGVVAALVVVGTGALATACDATPPAASANGATISTGTLNSQLSALQDTAAGGCLLQLEDAEVASVSGQGAGGPGTYTMAFANAVLELQVEDLLAEQYAASKGITVTAADVETATSDFESTLSGEINAAVQQSEAEGTVSLCQDATGASISGSELLAGLPAAIRMAEIRNQAVDEKLLARGADISPSAVAAYYEANLAEFTGACVSRIVTDSEAHADQFVTQIKGGASFAAVAEANSLDTQSAPNGGALGCDFTLAQVEQALQQQSVPVGTPIAPIEDPSSGQWIVYEVTSQTVEPLSAASSVARRELLQSTDNVDRVSRELVAFARRSDVSIDPQYGKWKDLSVVPPVAPPPQYLLAAASGSPSSSMTSSLGSAAGSGSTGSGSNGASGASGYSGSTGASGSTGGG
ncbi:MAG: peptidylprolyl isomerase [Acidimicrobiales bacterium]